MISNKHIKSAYVIAALLYGTAYLFAAAWNSAEAQDRHQTDQAPFEMFAEDILSGIRATDAADIPAVGGLRQAPDRRCPVPLRKNHDKRRMIV